MQVIEATCPNSTGNQPATGKRQFVNQRASCPSIVPCGVLASSKRVKFQNRVNSVVLHGRVNLHMLQPRIATLLLFYLYGLDGDQTKNSLSNTWCYRLREQPLQNIYVLNGKNRKIIGLPSQELGHGQGW